jgi:hypothetical protein
MVPGKRGFFQSIPWVETPNEQHKNQQKKDEKRRDPIVTRDRYTLGRS